MQRGDNDVTNPEPGTTSETTVARMNADGSWRWETQRYAIIKAGQPPLNTTVVPLMLYDDMMRIIIQAEKAYCTYKFGLPNETCSQIMHLNAKTALDFEFKFLGDRRVHCKQIREFAGTKLKYVTLPEIPGNTCQWISPAYFSPPGNESVSACSACVNLLLVFMRPGNVAFRKPTSTSGVAKAGDESKGVDGTATPTDTTMVLVTGSSATSTRWWEVDLGGGHHVKYLRVVGPTDARTDPPLSVIDYRCRNTGR